MSKAKVSAYGHLPGTLACPHLLTVASARLSECPALWPLLRTSPHARSPDGAHLLPDAHNQMRARTSMRRMTPIGSEETHTLSNTDENLQAANEDTTLLQLAGGMRRWGQAYMKNSERQPQTFARKSTFSSPHTRATCALLHTNSLRSNPIGLSKMYVKVQMYGRVRFGHWHLLATWERCLMILFDHFVGSLSSLSSFSDGGPCLSLRVGVFRCEGKIIGCMVGGPRPGGHWAANARHPEWSRAEASAEAVGSGGKL